MDKVLSVIGNESDLICIDCKKEKKARMSNLCLKCKIALEPNFLDKFKHFHRPKNSEVYICLGCKKTFTEKTGWVTSYLIYLCEDCYKQ